MRIRKKELLEAINKVSPQDVDKSLDIAKKTIDSAKELEQYAEPVIGSDNAKKFAEDVFTEEDSAVHTDKFDSCVEKVKKQGDVDNPYAVCQSSLGKKAINKSHRRKKVYEIKQVVKIKDIKK